MTTMRLAFMGTPDFAVPTLSELVAAGHEVAAVYCQPPRSAGRGKAVRKQAVHLFAESLGLTVRTPLNFKDPKEVEAFRGLNLDIAVVAAYGLILPKSILDAPNFGCINVHASLLPRWRGAAPIQRAIMAGDKETGVCIMAMEEGLDTGAVLLSEHVPITPTTTAGALHDVLAQVGAELTVRALAALSRGSLTPVPQSEEGVTYAKKIDKSEAHIDWRKSAEDLSHLIHGLSPSPGAWCEIPGHKKNLRIKVLTVRPVEGKGQPGEALDDHLTVACGTGALSLQTVQREGKKAVSAEELLRGLPIPKGTVLK